MLNIHAHGLFATIMMFYGPLNWEIGLLNIGLFFEGYLRIAVQKGVTSVTLGRGKNGDGTKRQPDMKRLGRFHMLPQQWHVVTELDEPDPRQASWEEFRRSLGKHTDPWVQAMTCRCEKGVVEWLG